MNVDIQEIAPCRKRISVDLTGDEVDAAFEESYGVLLAQAQLPGFRKGRVPRKMLERKFGNEIAEEVKAKLVDDNLRKALEENELTPFGDPDIDLDNLSAERGSGFSFTTEVDVRPVFDLGDYKSLELVRKVPAVRDEDVDERLEELRERFAEHEDVDGPAEPGMYLDADVRMTVDGEEICDVENQPVRLEGDVVVGVETGDLAELLEGLSAGDERTVSFTAGEKSVRDGIAGKEGELTVKVGKVTRRVLPELDDAFAERLGLGGMEELREIIRGDMEQDARNRAGQRLEQDLVEKLIEMHDFDLPEAVLDRLGEANAEELRSEVARYGASQEYLQEHEEELREGGRKRAERGLRRTLILGAIAEKEEVRVEEVDVQTHVQRLAANYGVTPQVMMRRISELDGAASMQSEILEMKTVARLLDELNVTEEEVSPEEFEAMGSDAAENDDADGTDESSETDQSPETGDEANEDKETDA